MEHVAHGWHCTGTALRSRTRVETGLGWNLKRACNRKRETHIRIWQFPVINLVYGRGIRFASCFKIYLYYTFAFARVQRYLTAIETYVKVCGTKIRYSIKNWKFLFDGFIYIFILPLSYWSSSIAILTLSTGFRNSLSEKCKNSLMFWHLK